MIIIGQAFVSVSEISKHARRLWQAMRDPARIAPKRRMHITSRSVNNDVECRPALFWRQTCLVMTDKQQNECSGLEGSLQKAEAINDFEVS